jgi:hypothetical protein
MRPAHTAAGGKSFTVNHTHSYTHMKELKMRTRSFTAAAMFVMMVCFSLSVNATPSTIIWIPSVDFQGFKSFHLGVDNYSFDYKAGKSGSGSMFPTDIGLTVGVLPDTIVEAEVGFDYFTPQWSPFSVNGKIGVPEGALASWSPAVAVGAFGVGFQKNVTDFNILYGIVGKTFPVIGRLEVGYYSGNKSLLIDPATGAADNSGVILSWDRQMPEISDNLWLAVDYQGGKSPMGAFSYGFAWTFAKNVSVIFARDVFKLDLPTATTIQLDINI